MSLGLTRPLTSTPSPKPDSPPKSAPSPTSVAPRGAAPVVVTPPDANASPSAPVASTALPSNAARRRRVTLPAPTPPDAPASSPQPPYSSDPATQAALNSAAAKPEPNTLEVAVDVPAGPKAHWTEEEKAAVRNAVETHPQPRRRAVSTPRDAPAPVHSVDPLHVRLRPKSFSEVIGQDVVTASVAKLLKSPDCPHVFVFTGPAGVGKTTLARIIASELGCDAPDEIDAATNNGVDAMRGICEHVQYKTLAGKPKVVIIDEVHAMSKGAWQASLKTLEEPPSHAYFVLCTTDADKIPTTVKTRAARFTLKPVGVQDLTYVGETAVKSEGLVIPDGALRYIVEYADGSVRQLLTGLAKAATVSTTAQLQTLLDEVEDDDTVRAMAQMLVSNRVAMERARKFMAAARGKGMEAEALRIGVVLYIEAVYFNHPTGRADLAPILGVLSQPVAARGGYAQLVAALDSVIGDRK